MFEISRKMRLTVLERIIIAAYRAGFEVKVTLKGGVLYLSRQRSTKDLRLVDLSGTLEKIWEYQREGFRLVYHFRL
ncbi:MAG: hypothetical protein LBP23_00625 [Treponema sp.]|jgi:hypothetical protein|nr:hypothetical protein [Treponema sp.]